MYKNTQKSIGFLSTAHVSICSYVRQFPANRSYRQAF